MKFEALQRLWYEKLKASGFRDVEASSPVSLSGDSRLRWAARHPHIQGYFERAAAICEALLGIDAKIWELHAEGKTIRFIAAHLQLSRSEVHRRVTFIRKEAGITYGD